MNRRDRVLKGMGMIPKYQFELPLSGKEKRFRVDGPAADEGWPSRLTILYNNKLLGVADSEFRRRGLYLGVCSIVALVVTGWFFALVSVPFFYPLAPFWMIPIFALMILPFIAGLLWLALQEKRRYAIYPVVFNRDSGNVHFFSIHDGQPVTYPWDSCTYCIVPKRNGGPEGSYHELRGYVLNEYDGVIDSFSIGEEVINLGRRYSGFVERWFSCNYEYIRQFMTLQDISGLAEPEEENYVSLKPSFKQSMRLVQPKVEPKSLMVRVFFVFVNAVIFIPKVVGGAGHYLCCKYCKVPQWSQEIIDECGPEIVLSNR